MRESNVEGVAIHDVPESCVGGREVDGEALTGVHAGWVSSREMQLSGVPTPFSHAEGNTWGRVIASDLTTQRGHRPHARVESPCARTGRSLGRPMQMVHRAVSGRRDAEHR